MSRAMLGARRALAAGVALLMIGASLPPAAVADDFSLPGGVSPEPPSAPGAGGQPAERNPSGEDPRIQQVTDPVHLDRGEFAHTQTDVRIPGRGLSIEFTRTYRSRSAYNGPLGYGWDFSYNRRLQHLEDGNVAILGGGNRQQDFMFDGTAYQPAPGAYASLIRNVDGTWTLTEAHGQRQVFASDGTLSAIVDRAGNQLTFEYDPAGRLPIHGRSDYFVVEIFAVLVRDHRLTRITDPAGRALTLTYNADGRLDRVQDWQGRFWTYQYDADGNLATVMSPATPEFPAGVTTTYVYGTGHNLTQIIDPKSQPYVVNQYRPDDRIESQFYGNGTSTIEYLPTLGCEVSPASGDPAYQVSLTFPGGSGLPEVNWSVPADRSTHPRDWIALNRVGVPNEDFSNQVELNGATTGTLAWALPSTEGRYEARYMVDGTFTSVAASTSICYGTGGLGVTENRVRVTDRKGFITEWIFDAAGHVTRQEEFTAGLRPGEPASYVTTHEYNAAGERIRTVFPAGNSIEWTYDETNTSPQARGNLLQIRRKAPAGSPDPDLVTQYTYEPQFNQIKTVTDPRGNITTYLYDYELATTDPDYGTVGNLVRITGPTVPGGQPVTRFTYNNFGQVLTITDPNANVTRNTYAAATGYLTQITRGLGSPKEATTVLGRDAVGNISSVTDARGNLTAFEYNALNQLTKVTAAAPFSFVTHYNYDANGNLIQLDRQAVAAPGPRPPLGTVDASDGWQSMVYAYTVLDQLQAVTDDLNHATTFAYDANGNRVAILDAQGHQTAFDYDERNLLFRVSDAAAPAGITEYAYDLNGNLVSLKDAKAQGTTYLYDGFDRLTRTTYPGGSFERYGYDLASNLTNRITPANQTLTYQYDALNRLQTKTTLEEVTTYGYDLGSRMTSAVDPDATLGFTYDALDRLATATTTYPGAAAKTVGYDFDGAGNRMRLTYPDAEIITYTYDALNRLDQVKNGATVLADYNHDPLSRRDTVTLLNGTSSTYQYDAANRLLNLTHRQGATLLQSFGYTYDNAGNRLTMTDDLGTHFYYPDPLYQLNIVDYPVGSPFADTTFNYDPVGNRLSTVAGATTAYVPNALNQYASVGGTAQVWTTNGNLQSDGTSTYTYDSENRLTQAVTPGGTTTYGYDPLGRRVRKTVAGVITRMYYDGDQRLVEASSSGIQSAKYLFGPGMDEPLRMIRGATTAWYHADGLGSLSELTNAAGTVTETYRYEAYGRPQAASTLGNPFLFTGREYDAETSLYHYRARAYDPKLGRFLQRDPLGYGPDINPYRYVQNNPLRWVDPNGLDKTKPWWSYFDDLLAAPVFAGEDSPGPSPPWWPKWAEALVPSYGNYGGPGRSHPALGLPPLDSLDALFRMHDFEWSQGHGATADHWLSEQLRRLPANPSEWMLPAPNPLWARTFRTWAQDLFDAINAARILAERGR